MEPTVPYPKVPKVVAGAGGPIRILWQQKVTYRGTDCWGLWDDATRTVTLCMGSTPAHQWRVLFHELAHAALADSGAECLFSEQVVELLCEAVATARMRERFG